MIRHWDQHLNVQQLLRDERPKHVLEVGALKGENSYNLALLGAEVGYRLTILSDDVVPEHCTFPPHVTAIKGVSYRVLPSFPDQSVDFVILDTDHNYWTLIQELSALDPKLTPGGLIILHDVDAFYYDPGLTVGYGDGSDYPRDDIMSMNQFGSTGTALIDFLALRKRDYRLVRWIPEACGAAIIRKNVPGWTITVRLAE